MNQPMNLAGVETEMSGHVESSPNLVAPAQTSPHGLFGSASGNASSTESSLPQSFRSNWQAQLAALLAGSDSSVHPATVPDAESVGSGSFTSSAQLIPTEISAEPTAPTSSTGSGLRSRLPAKQIPVRTASSPKNADRLSEPALLAQIAARRTGADRQTAKTEAAENSVSLHSSGPAAVRKSASSMNTVLVPFTPDIALQPFQTSQVSVLSTQPAPVVVPVPHGSKAETPPLHGLSDAQAPNIPSSTFADVPLLRSPQVAAGPQPLPSIPRHIGRDDSQASLRMAHPVAHETAALPPQSTVSLATGSSNSTTADLEESTISFASSPGPGQLPVARSQQDSTQELSPAHAGRTQQASVEKPRPVTAQSNDQASTQQPAPPPDERYERIIARQSSSATAERPQRVFIQDAVPTADESFQQPAALKPGVAAIGGPHRQGLVSAAEESSKPPSTQEPDPAATGFEANLSDPASLRTQYSVSLREQSAGVLKLLSPRPAPTSAAAPSSVNSKTRPEAAAYPVSTPSANPTPSIQNPQPKIPTGSHAQLPSQSSVESSPGSPRSDSGAVQASGPKSENKATTPAVIPPQPSPVEPAWNSSTTATQAPPPVANQPLRPSSTTSAPETPDATESAPLPSTVQPATTLQPSPQASDPQPPPLHRPMLIEPQPRVKTSEPGPNPFLSGSPVHEAQADTPSASQPQSAFSSTINPPLTGHSKPSDPAPSRPAHQTTANTDAAHLPHSFQVQTAVQSADASGLVRDPAAPDSATTFAGAETRHSTTVASSANEPFAALDAGPRPEAPAWVHAGPHRAEAGFQDPSLGWVGVRADSAGGQVHATLQPGSADAAQELGGHLTGLHSYLAELHTPVESITLAAPEGREVSLGGGQDQGQGMNQGTNQNPGQGASESHSHAQTATPSTAAGASPEARVTAVNLGSQVTESYVRSGNHISVIA